MTRMATAQSAAMVTKALPKRSLGVAAAKPMASRTTIHKMNRSNELASAFCHAGAASGISQPRLDMSGFWRSKSDGWTFCMTMTERMTLSRGEEEESKKPVKRNDKKVGRNDPCPCGSGKKYKRCHGAT